MLPDRADTIAVVEEAVTQAVDYWNTPNDEEQLLLARLGKQGVVITQQQFGVMVEARIAMTHADNHEDLTAWGLPDNCDWVTRVEFIHEQRVEWYDPAMKAVVTATRERHEATAADEANGAAA